MKTLNFKRHALTPSEPLVPYPCHTPPCVGVGLYPYPRIPS